MATKFNREDLHRQVQEQYTALLDSYDDKERAIRQEYPPLVEQEATWRQEQIDKVVEFARKVQENPDEVSNTELRKFRLRGFDPQPAWMFDHYRKNPIDRIREEKALAKRQMEQSLRFVNALATDENGNVFLTVSDLRNIGLLPKK